MRAWRKIESGIITSERLSSVSDSAKWLFTLLLVAQDDEGKYPWTPTMVKALTVSTTWADTDCDALLSELRIANVAEVREGFVVLRKGAEKNGTPHNSKKHVMLYPTMPVIAESNGESWASRGRVAYPSIEKSREDKKEPLSTEVRKKRAVRYTSLASAAALMELYSEEERVEMGKLFPLINLEWEAGKCVDWHNAKGGSGNWKLAFKNWLPNAKPSNGNSPASKWNLEGRPLEIYTTLKKETP